MVKFTAKARIVAIGLLSASLLVAQQSNATAAADIGVQSTCAYTQVASSPGPTEFINNSDLQSLLANAAGDSSCTDVAVQFTSGFDLVGAQELVWDGTQDLLLAGESKDSTQLDGVGASRILNVNNAASVTIANLTITGGLADASGGGGIYTRGELNVIDSAVTGNESVARGGGISVLGDISISGDSEISGNKAATLGGAIYAESNGDIDGALISGNIVAGTTSGELTGGGIAYTTGTFDIANSVISANEVQSTGSADVRGGGISSTGSLNVVASTISGNKTDSQGESIGSGVAVYSGSFTDSQITANTANAIGIISGVGICVTDELTLVRSTVSGNSGVSLGDDVRGAAIWVGGPATATNSTVTGNDGNGSGNVTPGIYGNSGTITVIFSTIVDNNVLGGNPQGREITGGNLLVAKGSVIANPNGPACETNTTSAQSTYNAREASDTSCGLDAGTDITSATWANMQLGALGDNGGPTQTRALGENSQLNGVVPNATGTTILGATPTDQRGVIRSDTSNTTQFAIGAEQNAVVSFNPNFGSGFMSPQQAVNTTALQANTYSRSGHVFVGWRTAPNSGTFYANQAQFPFATRAPGQANITLWAQWGNAVTYDGNANTGGSAPTDPDSPYVTGGTVTVLGKGSLVKSGEVFVGWNTHSDGSGTPYLPSATFAMPSTPVTLYAQWSPAYAMTYNGNGNTGGSAPTDPDSPYVSGDTVTVLGKGSLVKSGSVFVGWTFNSGGSDPTYRAGESFTMPSHAVTLYAKWSSTPPLTHTVTYFGNGKTSGSVPVDPSSPYAPGSIVTVLGKGTLVKSDAAFVGWNTKANGSGVTLRPGKTFRMAAKPVRLFAMWKPDTPPQPQTVRCLARRIHMSSDGTIPLTGPDCLSSDDVLVGTAFAFVNRGDYRQPRLMCQQKRQLSAPKRLPNRYGRNSFYCPRGVLVLDTHRVPAWYVVTWRAPATANALPFVKTVRFRI